MAATEHAETENHNDWLGWKYLFTQEPADKNNTYVPGIIPVNHNNSMCY